MDAPANNNTRVVQFGLMHQTWYSKTIHRLTPTETTPEQIRLFFI